MLNSMNAGKETFDIGRNDPCPCGSGKKYKYCCLNKQKKDVFSAIRETVKEEGYPVQLADVLCNLVHFMKKEKWIGACHATATVLYIVLSELGYNVCIYTGEVDNAELKPFDHSWITIDGKIIDIAVIMTLMNAMPVSDAIVLDKNVITGQHYSLRYGVKSALGLDEGTRWILGLSLSDYMDAHPRKDFLWDVACAIAPVSLRIDDLREKYKESYRSYYLRDIDNQ